MVFIFLSLAYFSLWNDLQEFVYCCKWKSLFLRLSSKPWWKHTVFSLSMHLLLSFKTMEQFPKSQCFVAQATSMSWKLCIPVLCDSGSLQRLFNTSRFYATDTFSYETQKVDTHSTKNVFLAHEMLISFCLYPCVILGFHTHREIDKSKKPFVTATKAFLFFSFSPFFT